MLKTSDFDTKDFGGLLTTGMKQIALQLTKKKNSVVNQTVNRKINNNSSLELEEEKIEKEKAEKRTRHASLAFEDAINNRFSAHQKAMSDLSKLPFRKDNNQNKIQSKKYYNKDRKKLKSMSKRKILFVCGNVCSAYTIILANNKNYRPVAIFPGILAVIFYASAKITK